MAKSETQKERERQLAQIAVEIDAAAAECQRCAIAMRSPLDPAIRKDVPTLIKVDGDSLMVNAVNFSGALERLKELKAQQLNLLMARD